MGLDATFSGTRKGPKVYTGGVPVDISDVVGLTLLHEAPQKFTADSLPLIVGMDDHVEDQGMTHFIAYYPAHAHSTSCKDTAGLVASRAGQEGKDSQSFHQRHRDLTDHAERCHRAGLGQGAGDQR